MMRRTLWQFATKLYTQDRVAEACLWLQDHCAVDVNILLFALWVGADARRALDRKAIASIDMAVEKWRLEIVEPLRNVRRRMKTGPEPAPSEATEKLRSKLKAVEVGAEKIELSLLEAFSLEAAGEVTKSDETLLHQNAQCVVDHFRSRARAVDGETSGTMDAAVRSAIATVSSAAAAMRIAA